MRLLMRPRMRRLRLRLLSNKKREKTEKKKIILNKENKDNLSHNMNHKKNKKCNKGRSSQKNVAEKMGKKV